ncbi:MAG: zinc ribbon domain-containing protein [Anaerolineales bacterium]|nr:zinc ribbon domain-containing protein [Anaerolineales bacterium]
MPLYDYHCLDCHQRFDIFLSFSEYGSTPVACPHCDSQNVKRRIPHVRLMRSEESHLEDMADPSTLEGLEENPRALGRMMRKMGSELGEEMPPEFDEVVDRLEKGQSPQEIEKEIPDLGSDMGGMGSMGGMGGMGGMSGGMGGGLGDDDDF